MMAQFQLNLPQEGTDRDAEGESLTGLGPVSPTDSGGGRFCYDDTDPFKRRDSIRRTPPGQPLIENEDTEATENDDVFEVTRENTPKRRNKKRKIIGSPTTSLEEGAQLPSEIINLQKKSKELMKFLNENKNIRKEVKRFALDISGLINRVSENYKNEATKFQELNQQFQQYKKEQELKAGILEDKIADIKLTYDNKFKDIMLNRGACSSCNCKEGIDLKYIKTYEDLSKSMKSVWRESDLENVTIEHNDMFEKSGENVVFFCNANKKNHSKMDNRILNHFPEAMESERIVC
jgi:hypothetical protein